MKRRFTFLFILTSIVFVALTLPAPSNSISPVLPATPYDYVNLNLPSYFTSNSPGSPLNTTINGTDNTPGNNPITDDGATLGRVLFYDKELSANGTIACASCHQAANGFSDSDVLSKGFSGGLTGRHSMTLINGTWYQRGRFFWDERAATLEEQVLMPFQDPVEMGLTLQQIDDIVSQQSYYPDLFLNAFGDTVVTTDRVSLALAQFIRSIVSYSSKYDIGRAQSSGPGGNFSNFTTDENTGKSLFFKTIPNGGGACFGCHTTEAFTSANPGPQNNGLDATTTDAGAGNTFSNNPIFDGRFKTSTLRNIELTAPYMHDGRFATLEEVVEHYNSGIQAHPTLSPALTDTNGDPVRLNFTTSEKAALVAFLKTLTDNSIATEPKWSDPFSAALPVELIAFSGKVEGEGILLEWQTLSETNNQSFTVEKSEDGENWRTLTSVEGAGNSLKLQDYSFLYREPRSEIQYYRLLQTDYDGKYDYSNVISVNWEQDKKPLMVYPNPFSDYLTLDWQGKSPSESITVQVYNNLGHLVFSSIKKPFETQVIDISTLAKGIYILRVIGDDIDEQTIKITKL
jgi:cytochrome c peroxidase